MKSLANWITGKNYFFTGFDRESAQHDVAVRDFGVFYSLLKISVTNSTSNLMQRNTQNKKLRLGYQILIKGLIK